MVSFAALSSVARRRAVPMVLQRTQKRHMGLGGHSGPPPEWEGVDKVVRSYFPYDYQLAMVILGAYTGMYALYSISSAFSPKKPKVEEKPAPAPVKIEITTTGVPDIESPAFDKFIESGALDKLLDNEEQLKALTD